MPPTERRPGDSRAARAAALTDGVIVEIIGTVALHIYTNILNKATRVDIDFPKVALFSVEEHAVA